MRTTITIRMDEALRKALLSRAEARCMTLSEAAREILREALERRPLGEKTGHLRGELKLPRKAAEPWRETLRERNWRG